MSYCFQIMRYVIGGSRGAPGASPPKGPYTFVMTEFLQNITASRFGVPPTRLAAPT